MRGSAACVLCGVSLMLSWIPSSSWAYSPSVPIKSQITSTYSPSSQQRSSLSMVEVTIKHACRHPINLESLNGFGRAMQASGTENRITSRSTDGEYVFIQSVSGISEEGEEVMAIVPALANLKSGGTVTAAPEHTVPKPKHLQWSEGCMLPYLALTCLIPVANIGLNQSNVVDKHVVVTGGHGTVAPFLAQVLSAWGGKVTVVTTQNAGDMKKFGASAVIDFRKASFHEEMEKVDHVIDTIGTEKEGAIKQLYDIRGAQYVSLMPAILGTAIDEGMIFGAGKLMAYKNMVTKTSAAPYWMPNEEAMRSVIAAAEAAIACKGLHVGTELVGMGEYLEALAWPKDADTGLRYGFPGKGSSIWDSFGTEDEDEESADGPGAPVVDVKGRGEVQQIVDGGGKGLIFVTTSSCQTCKFLNPYYNALARGGSYPGITFLRFDIKRDMAWARQLGLQAVPAFVSFTGGKVDKVVNTNDRDKIKKLIAEI